MSDNIDSIVGEKTEEEPRGGILGIFDSKKAKDASRVVELAEKVTELDVENSALHEAIATLKASESKLSDELTGLKSDYEASLSEIETLKASVEQAEESAGKQAAQIAAQSHVSPEDLPAADTSESGENTPASESELEEALQACDSHADRSKLVRQYRNRSNN